jgi:molybdopterin-guanine dinucleotide biosynthesis protein A
MQSLNHSHSVLNGLVLAGGRSTRMGEDKSIAKWHGKEQRYYVADILKACCDDVFISCKAEQEKAVDKNYKVITDEYEDAGPLGGILSAFHKKQGVAWLVVACDLPLLDEKTIRYLIQNRDKDAVATTFKSTHDSLPEPLITIWEPTALLLLETAVSEGKYSPQKVLIKAKIKLLEPPDASALMNVNTPEERQIILQMLKEKNSR